MHGITATILAIILKENDVTLIFHGTRQKWLRGIDCAISRKIENAAGGCWWSQVGVR